MTHEENSMEHGPVQGTEPEAVTPATLAALFHRAARFMARAHHHRGHARHAQGRVLDILGERGGVSQRELMDILQVRSASLSELLSKLERQGYIVRSRDEEDRRGMVAALTSEGEAALSGKDGEDPEETTTLFDALSREEQQEMGRLLIKLIVAWEEEGGMLRHGHRHHHHHHHHGHGPHHEHGPHHGRGGPHGRRRRSREPEGHAGPEHGHGPHAERRGFGAHGRVEDE